MSKTNSNCITSILVVALNNKESGFRKEMLDLFSKKIRRKIPDNVNFSDCTHSPLLYEEMKGTEIDIIARVPGIHKPVMMIEVKASIGETLQDSQVKNGAYERTANEHKIPLIYIIPKNYAHKDRLPEKAGQIYWEDIKKHITEMNVSFEKQIEQFVETYSDNDDLSVEEKKLLKDNDLLIQIFKFKKEKLDAIQSVLKEKNRKISSPQEDQWGVGYYYSTQKPKNDYFIGFNPDYKDDKFFALCIAETCKNINLGDKMNLYFEEGYYFIPILNSTCEDGDTKILNAIRNNNSLKQHIPEKIKANFSTFFSLKTKIGDEIFYSIFNENNEINTKEYNSLLKKI